MHDDTKSLHLRLGTVNMSNVNSLRFAVGVGRVGWCQVHANRKGMNTVTLKANETWIGTRADKSLGRFLYVIIRAQKLKHFPPELPANA